MARNQFLTSSFIIRDLTTILYNRFGRLPLKVSTNKNFPTTFFSVNGNFTRGDGMFPKNADASPNTMFRRCIQGSLCSNSSLISPFKDDGSTFFTNRVDRYNAIVIDYIINNFSCSLDCKEDVSSFCLNFPCAVN